ncbi:phage replisome organizer N-terminal domain-containing protein [Clostridium swellfunianum]|uniref:phage replisome organizer N-terminal domain-containing protein n=1 Tax=Clostridium swellfunianum TaxID=1367462 RepID=UPI00202FE9CE|nr:phage replisome organizer N-terminal domain-containing protein [Clostridium swellfunianum]MCM0647427.1 phage replisome organizer N-terminal domain-containing protein [Clostridium swellfunianum]
MSDIKKYYFLKLKDNFFETQEVKILESMPDGIYFSNLLLKLYLIALRNNGALKLKEDIPYDKKMLASLTNLSMKTVNKGIDLLISLGFIEVLQDGTMFMKHISNFIGSSNSEADRKKMYRNKLNDNEDILEKISPKYITKPGTSIDIFLDKCPPENRETDIKTKNSELRSLDNREKANKEDINSLSVCLLKDFEARTGLAQSINLGSLKKAVQLHGFNNVTMAMDKALEKNKPTMTYINGILKNWVQEGYPKEVVQSGNGGTVKNNAADSQEFSGFKPKEPRCLSQGEREALEGELL